MALDKQSISALEHILTSTSKADMISYLTSHPEDFDQAINLAISNRQPYSWRAAWLLWSCMDENDRRIQGYVNRIIDSIPTKKDQQQRELLIILQKMQVNETQEGVLFNICVGVWKDVSKKPAVRINALKLIVKIVKKYPELVNELELLTQEQYLESLSRAAKKSISKMFMELNYK